MSRRLGGRVAVSSCFLALMTSMGCGSGGASRPDGAGAEGCGVAIADTAPVVCSTVGVTHAPLMVHNTCGALTIQMFWVNYQCAEMSYGTVAPGQTFNNNSWVSHPWRLRDATTHTLLREIPA